MKYTIDPGKKKKTLSMMDEIVYKQVTDLEGNPLDLHISLINQMGNSEMRAASGIDDELVNDRNKVVVWINGGGWHHGRRNMMAAEMVYLAEAGYCVAIVEYRGSEKGKWPAQIEDVKEGIRFLRANADRFKIDASSVAVMGRSAGGHLAAMAAMNTDDFITEAWPGVSSEVQACIDMFGPTDMEMQNAVSEEGFKKPGARWTKFEDTHEGKLMGGDMSTLKERIKNASPVNFVNEKMCPMLILHGDEDPLVNIKISESLYDKIAAAGMEDRVDLVTLKHGGHGTREFWQPETRQLILDFLGKTL